MARVFDPVSLRLFVAVCEEGSIARAAEREAIVPSAISKRLAALEGDIGVSLLARGKGRLVPTPAGDALLRQSRELLRLMERMHAELSEFGTGVQVNLRVLVSLSVISESLPDDISAFLAMHPQVRVNIEEKTSGEIARGVREGTADFGVCWNAIDLTGLETRDYRSDRVWLVVHPGHALAGRGSVPFRDTLDYESIGVMPDSIMEAMLRRLCAAEGRVRVPRVVVSTFDAACRAVAANLGIAVLPGEVAAPFVQTLGLRMVRLDDAWARRQFVVAMRSSAGLSATARELVEHLCQRARRPDEVA
ncbi:LysR substrate-binding domain-containing protein [Derxia gummosa]|uniref:LysR substrate-binding domain-containing protein n=1 Tax=Derxia gummosa DSM 723 TaxID=1121388 RepID=A0A8B6X426_9BURK|nr:LysR substrate-binding domain-containing protein [Derxia gummosa]